MHIDIFKKDLRLRTKPQGGGCVLLSGKPCGLYLADPTFEEWDSQLRNCASIYKEIGISEEDNLITLSTCTSAEGNSRTILVGKIIESRKDDAFHGKGCQWSLLV